LFREQKDGAQKVRNLGYFYQYRRFRAQNPVQLDPGVSPGPSLYQSFYFERRAEMKNVIIIMVVLAMASVASAALTLSAVNTMLYAPGQSTMLTVRTDSAMQMFDIYNILLLVDTTKGSVDYTSGNVISTDSGMADTTLFNNIKFTSNNWGYATVTLYYLNEDFTSLTNGFSVTIRTIPEPMTLGLLGIGGLFLRRRK
jgi:hypothetical protein